MELLLSEGEELEFLSITYKAQITNVNEMIDRPSVLRTINSTDRATTALHRHGNIALHRHACQKTHSTSLWQRFRDIREFTEMITVV